MREEGEEEDREDDEQYNMKNESVDCGEMFFAGALLQVKKERIYYNRVRLRVAGRVQPCNHNDNRT